MSWVGGEHIQAAASEMVDELMLHRDRDWHARAGTLEWSCWTTAAHVAHDLLAYAGQVAAQAKDRYLPVDFVVRSSASPVQVLEVVTACARLLSDAVANAPAGPVAWHWGMSDAEGFAAMGVAELLVHTFDITQGLGVDWLPPDSLSQPVVARLIADAPPGPAARVLLWATGRAGLEGLPRVTSWVWRPALV